MFLSNPAKKQQFIKFILDALSSYGTCVLHAKGDADTVIVKTTLDSAATNMTTLVGDDRDPLVPLHHAKNLNEVIVTYCIFWTTTAKTTKRVQMFETKCFEQAIAQDLLERLEVK